jgi:hypothetical protein
MVRVKREGVEVILGASGINLIHESDRVDGRASEVDDRPTTPPMIETEGSAALIFGYAALSRSVWPAGSGVGV